jgi:hypothetical protein
MTEISSASLFSLTRKSFICVHLILSKVELRHKSTTEESYLCYTLFHCGIFQYSVLWRGLSYLSLLFLFRLLFFLPNIFEMHHILICGILGSGVGLWMNSVCFIVTLLFHSCFLLPFSLSFHLTNRRPLKRNDGLFSGGFNV